ncbi:MarR family winged helix-turn-helix transcriptional regulator [Pseudooceanicola algae]|uniref:MarR family winged helix-turn-helix transcriptional regulator n=1 Tax=Pseudooceanicola algae TaxID=1537215 RepID=UPI0018AD2D52|nr:MarR family winged helix-turn-helix transcriptional regulator [Pseudooceanicola algae]
MPDNPDPAPVPQAVEVTYSFEETLSHLLRRSHFHAESLFSQIHEDLEVTSRQLTLMIAVEQNPGASQRVLSQAVSLDVNTVSDTLRRMERKSLVARAASQQDARSVSVVLTDHGRNIRQAAAARNALFQDLITEKLLPDEAAQLKNLICKMLDDTGGRS